MLTGAAWSDACILNISSRGLLIQTSRSTPQGSVVELRRDDHVIVARVVWREGMRAGLSAADRLPVEEILSLRQSSTLQPKAVDGQVIDRRKRQRMQDAYEEGRLASRTMEFASVAVIAVCLAGTVFTLAEQALASPIAYIEAALGR
jgi:hypothetical protein